MSSGDGDGKALTCPRCKAINRFKAGEANVCRTCEYPKEVPNRRVCVSCSTFEKVDPAERGLPCAGCGKSAFFVTPNRFKELYPDRTIALPPATPVPPQGGPKKTYTQQEKEKTRVLAVIAAIIIAGVWIFSASSDSDAPDADSGESYSPPSMWTLRIEVVNNMHGTLEVDYYAWGKGSGTLDYGTTKRAGVGANTYSKALPTNVNSFELRIAAYYAGGETCGPEEIEVFSNPSHGEMTATFTIDSGCKTSLAVW